MNAPKSSGDFIHHRHRQLDLELKRIRREAYKAGYCDGAYKCKLGETDVMDHYNEWAAAGCPPVPDNA